MVIRKGDQIALKHGQAQAGKETAEYKSWKNMLNRCRNKRCKQFKDYGGRGIKVCDRWYDFENFFQDMGVRPDSSYQIDRKDNSKGYSQENCKWSTRKEQGRNKRNNVMLALNGTTKCLAEWSEETGLPYDTLRYRVNAGWSDEKTLTMPLSRTGPKILIPGDK